MTSIALREATMTMMKDGVLFAWRSCLVVLLLFTLALVPSAARAQAVTGTILGNVVDSTGSVVPGAALTLTHTGTGFTRTVTTDTSGEYSAPSLPTGKYTVAAELSGFKKMTAAKVDVGVDQR